MFEAVYGITVTNGVFEWIWEADVLGLGRIFEWVKKSVEDGEYDNLSWMSFNATANLKELQDAAAKLGMWNLSNIVTRAQGRISGGAQKDASKTVEEGDD